MMVFVLINMKITTFIVIRVIIKTKKKKKIKINFLEKVTTIQIN